MATEPVSPVFRLRMRGPGADRFLSYEPHRSLLRWTDSNEPVALGPLVPFLPASPPPPPAGTLQLLKIQVGFGCNMSCGYCSQAGQRAPAGRGEATAESFLEKFLPALRSASLRVGEGTRIEFWGGETLLYWERVRALAERLRAEFPGAKFLLFTNGTMFREGMEEEFARLGLQAVVSHDGRATLAARGRDPLQEPRSLGRIRAMHAKLAPLGLFTFHATTSPANPSASAIRAEIAGALGVPLREVILSEEQVIAYGESSRAFLREPGLVTARVFAELTTGGSRALLAGAASRRVGGFLRSLLEQRPASQVSQKCGMELPSSLAVNLEGDILTCQNTSAAAGHAIGSLATLALDRGGAFRTWRSRRECGTCPVLQLCRGSCMLLEGQEWKVSCEHSFRWNLAYLAASLFFLTGLTLAGISGAEIRGELAEEELEVIPEAPGPGARAIKADSPVPLTDSAR